VRELHLFPFREDLELAESLVESPAVLFVFGEGDEFDRRARWVG
jgi:hypothetical protein